MPQPMNLDRVNFTGYVASVWQTQKGNWFITVENLYARLVCRVDEKLTPSMPAPGTFGTFGLGIVNPSFTDANGVIKTRRCFDAEGKTKWEIWFLG